MEEEVHKIEIWSWGLAGWRARESVSQMLLDAGSRPGETLRDVSSRGRWLVEVEPGPEAGLAAGGRTRRLIPLPPSPSEWVVVELQSSPHRSLRRRYAAGEPGGRGFTQEPRPAHRSAALPAQPAGAPWGRDRARRADGGRPR